MITPSMPTGSELQELILRALQSLGGSAHRTTIFRRVITLGAFTREQLAVAPPTTNQGRFNNHIECLTSTNLSALKKKGYIDNVGGGDWVLL